MSESERDTDEPTENTPEDGALLARLRRGEVDAASELYRKYAERLTRVAQRQTATNLASRFDPEDVVQSVPTTCRTPRSCGNCCS
jgi:hypothetical protein